jgi:hypothetical protein
MDAFVQLALIEKVKRVFSDDPRVMLSFPLLAPLSFTEAELAAVLAPNTPADFAVAADFARAVNFLPRDMVASATERMLWDVFGDVLARAEVAAAESQGGDATAASSLLYDLAPDGTRTESEALKRYRQYRDAWFVARENYATHKLTGELSEDPEVRQRWLEVEEPELRAAQDAAMTDWDTLGNRVQIELAIQAEREAGLRNPQLRWAEWSHGFNPDTDMLTETNGGHYAPTGLSPRNFVSEGDWLSFELSAGEMATLVAEAPEQFKAVLGDDTQSRFERVSFEYRSVAINRPWFRPDVLTSQIWRTTDPELILSDGADPPSGVCPAYTTAIVFMRNLKVVERGSSTEHPFTDPRFTLNPDTFTKRRDLDPTRFIRRAAVAEPTPSMALDARRAFVRVQDNSFAVSPQILEAARASRFSVGRLRRPWTLEVARRGIQLDPEVVGGIQLDPEVVGTSPPPPPPPPPPIRPDELSVLAFICKRLPKAPDPAPTLHWV